MTDTFEPPIPSPLIEKIRDQYLKVGYDLSDANKAASDAIEIAYPIIRKHEVLHPSPDSSLHEKLYQLGITKGRGDKCRMVPLEDVFDIVVTHPTPDSDLRNTLFRVRGILASGTKELTGRIVREITQVLGDDFDMGDVPVRKEETQTHGLEPSDSGITTLPKLGDACNTGSPCEIPDNIEGVCAIYESLMAQYKGGLVYHPHTAAAQVWSMRKALEVYTPKPVSVDVNPLIAEIQTERNKVTRVYTPSAPYDWCIQAIRRYFVNYKHGE